MKKQGEIHTKIHRQICILGDLMQLFLRFNSFFSISSILVHNLPFSNFRWWCVPSSFPSSFSSQLAAFWRRNNRHRQRHQRFGVFHQNFQIFRIFQAPYPPPPPPAPKPQQYPVKNATAGGRYYGGGYAAKEGGEYEYAHGSGYRLVDGQCRGRGTFWDNFDPWPFWWSISYGFFGTILFLSIFWIIFIFSEIFGPFPLYIVSRKTYF